MATQRTTTSLGIVDLLRLRGFHPNRPTRLVRHGGEYAVGDLLRRGWFQFYQATQSRPRFDDCKCIVSFIGVGGTRARFIGVYRVNGRSKDCRPRPGPAGFDSWYVESDHYLYDLEREAGYEDLEKRVVIEWGKAARSYVQLLSNKEVVEVLPKGQFRPPFRDYLEFTLTHSELKDLYEHEEANKEWRARLKAVAGIYLILMSLARSEVLTWEQRYKEKLGSRATGLNRN